MSYTPQALELARLIAPAFPQCTRLDAAPIANATMFLERQLTFVRSKTETVRYAPLNALKYLPKATDIPIDANKFTYFVYDKTGKARIGNTNAKDIPRIDVGAREVEGHCLSVVASYGWTVTDLRQAARLNVPLTTVKSDACGMAIAQSVDEVLRIGYLSTTGQTSTNVGGFVNCSDVGSSLTMHNWFHTSSSTRATPEEMVNDLNSLCTKPNIDSKQVYLTDSLIIAPEMYAVAQMTKMSSASSVSVLKYFLDNWGGPMKIDQWWALSSGNVPDVTSNHRAIAYCNRADVLEAVVPVEFEQFPAQQEGLEFVVPCHARCGGVKIYQPVAMQYGNFSTATS
jgi:hypothetical protein